MAGWAQAQPAGPLSIVPFRYCVSLIYGLSLGLKQQEVETKKVALVTGSGRGLGRRLALHLAGRGFDLALHFHRSEAGAREVREQIQNSGRRAELFQADLCFEAGSKSLAEGVATAFGRLDLLVNNAGAYHETSFLEATEAEWFAELNSTATAVYFTTRALLPLLRDSRGRVVNLGDGVCDRPGARSQAPAYHIGKTGVFILTRSFARSEAPWEVPVNLLSPGLLETSVGLTSPEQDRVPAGRFGKETDLFSALDFLALEASPYLTGSNLIVGGGWNL